MSLSPIPIAPGARVLVRDAEWLVSRVDRTQNGNQAITAIGLSELVKDKEAIFLTHIDRDIKVMDPAKTRIVPDASPQFREAKLYIESLLRQTPPTDERIYLGHQAAIDPVPYQLDPAHQALKQPRQRILIADAVGLGKTIELGILLSELIARGKARRILVLAVKSMLTQFQKELWCRFTIPLTRLDSLGIKRIRSHIPTNHNPFYYFDKTIISIDTLKQDSEYRTYLENCFWDVIVIDEAHNVAERGTRSMRARLARLLASQSDTLIMLTATPHDGRPRSFASLMNMLDPTAIADPEHYGPEDIRGLFIRRFKKDIIDQVGDAFRQRHIAVKKAQASPAEEAVFAFLADLSFARLDQRRGPGQLFKTTLEKALFSSPAACRQTIANRLRRLEKEESPEALADRKHLRELERLLSEIGIGDFTKYQALLAGIRENLQWNGRDSEDRLVIFTERIETLKFLDENLRKDLGLKDKQIAQLRGDMSDVDQQAVVERFGKGDDPLRLLIASDVASEGINLHYQCHKMIHFDIPWSLMVFQQRNGRIDRYGQKHTPFIVYLITESGHNKIRGDVRILELLIEKDEQAVRNIGDPSALMGVYNIQQEEDITARAIESGEGAQALEAAMSSPRTANMMELVMKEAQVAPSPDSPTGERFSLFADDYHYLKTALGHLQQGETLQVSFDDARNTVNLTPPKSLAHRLKRLPREMRPDRGEFVLTADRMQVQAAMDRARREESSWPDIQLLWSLHPMLLWLNDTVRAAFGRMEAPLLRLSSLKEDECFFLISGLLPNRKSHPLVYRWFGVGFESGEFREILPLEALLEKTELHRRDFANTGVNDPVPAEMPILLERALEKARSRMEEERVQYQTQMRPRLKDHLQRLSTLEQKQLEQAKINSETGKLSQTEYGRTQRQIARVFQNHLTWIEDTLETGDTPYLQVVAVMLGR